MCVFLPEIFKKSHLTTLKYVVMVILYVKVQNFLKTVLVLKAFVIYATYRRYIFGKATIHLKSSSRVGLIHKPT